MSLWSRRGMLAAAGAVALPAPSFAAEYSESQLNDMFMAGGEKAKTATDYLAEHPELMLPVSLGNVSLLMWRRGDRLKAAFWLYVYQIRMFAWGLSDAKWQPAFQQQMDEGGWEIDDWAASDFEAWRALVRRAIAFEATFPLYADPAAGGPTAEMVRSVRQSYVANFERTAGSLTVAEATVRREANKLYVGPWKDPGAPLLDRWR